MRHFADANYPQCPKCGCCQERLDLSRVVETLENERDLLVAKIKELTA